MKDKTGLLITGGVALFLFAAATGIKAQAATVQGEEADNESDNAIERTWEATREGSAKAWDKTKEVSGDAWEATREGSAKAWDKTKEVSGEAWDKVSGDEEPAVPDEAGGSQSLETE